MKSLKKNLEIITLLCLLVIGFTIRLYRFNNPIADWHSWRQADTSAVSWNFVAHGFDVLHPMYFDISNVQSGKDNPNAYRYVEFPLYNVAQAGLYKFVGIFTLEEWGRLITIVFSLTGSLFLFLLVKRKANTFSAWLVLLFSLFLPYNIYYGRTILPDTSMVATTLGGILFLDVWLDGFRKHKKGNILFLCIALLFTASSFLLKPYSLFYGLPMLVLVFSIFRWRIFTRWELWAFVVFSLLPLVLWRKYILSYPEGIPVNNWLFNGNGIRFRPAFFRWIFYERITRLISGFLNTIFLVAGTIGIWKQKNDRWFFLSFVVSALAYLCVLATGNVQHDYYQIVIMPAVALLMGFGAAWLVGLLRRFVPQTIVYAVIGIIILIGFWVSWQQVKDYFNINNPALVVAGNAVDRLTPKNAKVVAPYDGDTTFLYYTKRKGWPSFEYSLDILQHMGADYLVLVNPKPGDYGIGKQYKIIAAAKEYLLFDLHQKP